MASLVRSCLTVGGWSARLDRVRSLRDGTAAAGASYDRVVAMLQVSAERFISSPPADLYRYLSDFRAHHLRFLPPAFSDFRVEEGGVGAGTVHSFRLKAGGRSRSYRMRVGEPEPGRVLTESDTASSLVTTFVVAAERSGSRVRIETRWDGARGVKGFFERLFAPRVLRRLYADELERLDRYARAAATG
jgi:Polyketide cyclase / dehydrase and lipid transport